VTLGIVDSAGVTQTGNVRRSNEDSYLMRSPLFMVADGMGGAAAGEIASAMAVEIVLGQLRTAWLSDASGGAESFVRALKQSAKAANEQIHAYAASHPEFRGMGTTATIAGLLGDTLYLAQVSDSRAYLVRDGVARQITKDQSLMQKLIEAGELTEEEAEHSERELERALTGCGETVLRSVRGGR